LTWFSDGSGVVREDGRLVLSTVWVCDPTVSTRLVQPKIGTVPRWGAVALIFVAMDICNKVAYIPHYRIRMPRRFV
jgi:hypothetical protein